MKKILIGMFALLFTCLFLAFNTSLPIVDIKNQTYHIIYSQELEQPTQIEYKITCNKLSKKYYSRSGLTFYKEPTIHTSDDADYFNNQWDKGHMAPAAAFNCNLNDLKRTFSYVNCALQHKDLNRGPWKELEAYEKELAINNIVTITIYVDFSKSSRLPTGASIPTGFSKVITLNGKLFKTYYFPNESVKGSYEKYLIKKY